MASYAAAVDVFRSSAAAAAAAGDGSGGIEGVAAEDLAAMQALMEEDENSPDAFALAEDESLDYDVRLLGRNTYFASACNTTVTPVAATAVASRAFSTLSLFEILIKVFESMGTPP